MYVTKIREEMIKSNEDLVNSDDDNIYYLINQKRQSLPAIFPKKFYIRPCCQPRKMPTVHLERFKIKLEEKDACFAPGDVIAGNVQIIASTLFNITKNTIFKFQKCSHSANENDDALHIKKLKMNVLGIIKIKEENKLMFNETFLRMEADLLVNKGDNNTTTVRAGDVKTIKFEIRLPQKGLFTSLESKSVSVLYTVQLELIYKNNKSEEELNAKTICGFTVVDCFDLARMPKFYFQPCSQNVVKKFGLFSCTGGQIRLNFSINGVAFVGGENIIIEEIEATYTNLNENNNLIENNLKNSETEKEEEIEQNLNNSELILFKEAKKDIEAIKNEFNHLEFVLEIFNEKNRFFCPSYVDGLFLENLKWKENCWNWFNIWVPVKNWIQFLIVIDNPYGGPPKLNLSVRPIFENIDETITLHEQIQNKRNFKVCSEMVK